MHVGVSRLASSDPFGPSDIDPDDVRDTACDATAPSRACQPPTTQAPSEPSTPRDLPDAGGIGALGQLLVVLLAVALLVAIGWLVMRYFGDARIERDEDDADESDLDESIDELVDERVIDHETPPDRWRRRAAEHREDGNYRESVRCEYRALVGDLARAGHVDEIPGRTSGEEREQIAELAPGLGARGHDVAQQFDAAADIFDSAWFNDLVVTEADDADFVRAAGSVLDVMMSSSGPRFAGARRT